jgi:AsmA protein
MRKFFRYALKIAGVGVAVILVALVLTPILFGDRIKEEVKLLANKSLRCETGFSDVSLSFFSHFPHLTLTIDNLFLKGSAPFDQDTLLSARKVSLGVNVSSLFGNTIVISRVWLDRARVNILYNKEGKSNFEVYESDTVTAGSVDTASGGPQISIERISFKNTRLVYADYSLPLEVVLGDMHYEGKSQVTSDFFDITSKAEIGTLDVTYDGQQYLAGKPVKANLRTRINSRDLTIHFEKNDLKIKDIPVQFNGKFNFEKEGYQLNLSVLSVMEKEFLSARVKVKQEKEMWVFAKANASIDLGRWARALDVKSVDLRGFYEMNLDAEGYYITGPVKTGFRGETDTTILSIPRFSLMSRLSDGYCKFASLPHAIDGLSFDFNSSCPGNDYRAINADLTKFSASFLKNRLNGYFKIGNLAEMPVEARFKGRCNLAEISQVIPLDSLTLGGILDIDATVKGNYIPDDKKFPETNIKLTLTDGLVKTPYYPAPVEKVNLQAEVTCPTTEMKDVRVNLSPATFSFEGKEFNMALSAVNLDDVQYDLTARGTIDLGRIYRVFSQQGMALEGYIDVDLALKGRQSDAVSGRYDRLHNKGTLELREIAFRSDFFPKPFIIRQGEFRFDQDKIWFDHFLATYGASDFRLKGALRNTLNYILSQGGSLAGSFDLTSDLINVDEFMVFAGDTTPSSTPSAPGVVMIPADLDIDFRAAVKRVAFEGLEVKDLKGEITLKEGILVMKSAGFELIGCKVAMDATYGHITPQKAHFDFHIKADDFDIRRAYNDVAMIREMAPSAGKAEGIVSLDYAVSGRLDAEMMPILPSLEGGGTLSIKKVKVYGLKLFNDISKSTEREGLKNPDLSKVDIKSSIKNNTVTLEQFKFKVSGIRLRISGTTTFDQKVNLRIRLGLPPMGIFGIPLKVTGPMEDLKIRYGKGGDKEELPDDEYTDELPEEMLKRIKHAKDDEGDEL